MTSEAKKVIDSIVEGWNKQDWAILEAVHSPNWIDHSSPEGANDLASMKVFFDLFTDSFPDMEMEILEVFLNGNEGAYYYTIRGTHEKTFLNFPPSGKQVELFGMIMLRVENGLCAEAWGVTDRMTFFHQLRSASQGN